ncbi:biotin transporter BioY [bacterium]|nr:MAG: biotin transporter BioY [bacterium]
MCDSGKTCGNISCVVQPVKSASAVNGFLLNTVLVFGMACVTAIAAQATIPWEPVPFTMQTVAVLLSGLLLGARKGYMSQLVYLGAGVAGWPVFAGGGHGLHTAIGETGGYLISFPLAAMALGFMSEAGWTRSFRGAVLALFFGNALILALGWGWLSVAIGPRAAFIHGVAPFLQGAVLKSILVFACLPGVWSGSFRRG